MASNLTYSEGMCHPLGSSVQKNGVNFSLFSENATGVELLLFESHDSKEPFQTIHLDPIKNRTFSFWHILVEGLKEGAIYAYRVDGPWKPEDGMRFNKNKVLVDPYARGLTNTLWDRVRACDFEDNLDCSLRSVVVDHKDYDWEGDEPLKTRIEDTIIYETHVGGFTRCPSAKSSYPGTFNGIIEKIPYFKELGINAVELMPIFEFDNTEVLKKLDDGTVLTNYWGYSTLNFFAPESSYCSCPEDGEHLNEFRDMVKALHKEGIQVILDVVFNHTNEGNHEGPTMSFKGLDNKIYYSLSESNKSYYMDFTGCGNTFDVNHPISDKLITECLEFWVKEMHVDGFRFDEGAVFSRDYRGNLLEYPPIIWNIELSEALADTKLIAEAWDAGGLYQIGSFPGYRWGEWNGKYRDDIRRFIRGDKGIISNVASRIGGSADIYQHERHSPQNSINFICCHDGFTMKDLVSYNQKHNFANGEDNRDGIDDNLSCNYGYEGPNGDQTLESFRKRQIKNMFSILMLSQGTPMFLFGDELGRTQNGNNNAYCQNNSIGWMNWDLKSENEDLFNYFKNMISFRKNNSSLRRGEFFDGSVNKRGIPEISWHGCLLNKPGWNDLEARTLSFTLGSFEDNEPDIHVILNMYDEALDFELPQLPNDMVWKVFADTSIPAPNDIGSLKKVDSNQYKADFFSTVILISSNK